jgi:uncharacterized membrane protein YfcA
MVVTQSLDFAHSVIARVNTDQHGSGNWVATLILAGVFLPAMLGAVGTSGISRLEASAFFPAAILLALGYTYLRRRPLNQLRQTIAHPVPHERLVACVFLFVATVLSALAARTSNWAGPVVLLLLSALPWQRWAVPPGAP